MLFTNFTTSIIIFFKDHEAKKTLYAYIHCIDLRNADPGTVVLYRRRENSFCFPVQFIKLEFSLL